MKSICVFLLSLFLVSATVQRTDELPATNKKVVEYVNNVIGKKVGAGECWDLANEALTYAKAKWTFPNTFGKEYDRKKTKCLPGDLIQLSNVLIESRNGNSISRITMEKHTVIIYEVMENGHIKVAEQNFNNIRKIVINEWNLNDIKKGKLHFYRPQPL